MTHFSTTCIREPLVFCADVFFTTSFTQTGGAQARFAFNGDAVAIYGAVSLADYTVTTDGVPQSFQSCSDGLTSNVHVGVSMLGRRQAAR